MVATERPLEIGQVIIMDPYRYTIQREIDRQEFDRFMDEHHNGNMGIGRVGLSKSDAPGRAEFVGKAKAPGDEMQNYYFVRIEKLPNLIN